LPGRDNKFALEPDDFTMMVENINAAEKTLINHGLDFQNIENDTVKNYRGRWEPHDYE
jgi:sialic acid synthase SpsE